MNANRTYADDLLGEMSPAGQRVQQTLSPYQQFRVSGSVTPPSQSIDDPLGAFESLDPADDSFLEKQSVIFQSAPPELFRNPAVQNRIRQANAQHAEAQSYFKEDPENVDFYISQVQSGVAPDVAIGELRKRAQDNALKGAFLKSGGLVEEYEKLRDPSTGQVDRFSALDYLNKAERASKVKAATSPKPLSAESYNRLLQAQEDLEAAQSSVPTVPEDDAKLKADAFKKKFNRAPSSEQDWGVAYDLAYPNIGKARSRFESLQKALGSQYVMPAEFGGTNQGPEWMDGPNLLQQNTGIAPTSEEVATEAPALVSSAAQVGSPSQLPVQEEARTLGVPEEEITPAKQRASDATSDQLRELFSKEREKAAQSLESKFSSLGNEDYVKRAARSILQNESFPASVVGLPDRKDSLGGTVFMPAVDLIAEKLGIDPDAPIRGKGEKGEYTLFHIPKSQEGGRGIKDLPINDPAIKKAGEPVTWRDVLTDYAKKLVGEQGGVQSPIKSSVPNVTIGQIRQVP